jgi:hypothetical protein
MIRDAQPGGGGGQQDSPAAIPAQTPTAGPLAGEGRGPGLGRSLAFTDAAVFRRAADGLDPDISRPTGDQRTGVDPVAPPGSTVRTSIPG